MPEEEYRKDFSAEESESIKLCETRPRMCSWFLKRAEGEERDNLYRQTGIYVAAHSHVRLPCGTEAWFEHGCGTAEAVDFMLKGDYQNGKMFRPSNEGAVIHIATPRVSKTQEFPVTVNLLENEAGSLKEVLAQTDRFNRDVRKESFQDVEPLLAPEYIHHAVSNRLQKVYDAADQLSMKWQKHY